MCNFSTLFDVFFKKVKDVITLFNITGSAHKLLALTIEKEKESPDEQLFLRLSMGVG
jgi:hypothetical protein